MKTLKNLLVALVTLFTVTSFAQTTYTHQLVSGDFDIPNSYNIMVGDSIVIYNGCVGTDFVYRINVGSWTSQYFNVGDVIYSYKIQSIGDILVEVQSTFTISTASINYMVSENTSGVNDLSDVTFSVYPNPTTNFLNISGDNIETVKVFDMNGRIVLSELVNTSNVRLDVSTLNNGYYTVLVNDVKPIKFIKN